MEELKSNVSLGLTKEVKCEKCENTTFTEAFLLRKVSRLITGAAKDAVMPITIFCCFLCGTPIPETVPNELKEQDA